MSYTSATDQKFLGTLESWLRSLPEILVLIRYPASGNREFEFFSSFEVLSNRIRQLPPNTSVIAFRQRQLPLRGIVDDQFIASCLGCILDRAKFLVVETARRAYGRKSWFHSAEGETHAELREALEGSRGVPVAVGPYPPWLEDTDDTVSAIVPDENGIVRVSVY
jgi:hypothetical protein